MAYILVERVVKGEPDWRGELAATGASKIIVRATAA